MAFLRFSITTDPHYPQALYRLTKTNQTLLDLGCCFGQEIRTLVVAGAPSSLEQEFIDLGYELFNNKGKPHFTTGDFFDDATLPPFSETKLDMIHSTSFFHLFSQPQQIAAISKAVRLLKPKAGSILFWRQMTTDTVEAIKHPATRLGEMYRHTKVSLRNLLEQVVAEMGVGTDCEVADAGKVKVGESVDAFWLAAFCVKLL
ncbi:hypothetical protein LTR62_003984 [Meristemomyces frigidus]|uniref:Methyltransferase type 11 domain-containing protein n=1 Tax=Meristemomyces frigidus TaxID=1508187 RepID=A0AAN7TR60_9PEZI|nr:hypothetical protein LTR62_003984 [Meristemomyces frigidus]